MSSGNLDKVRRGLGFLGFRASNVGTLGFRA